MKRFLPPLVVAVIVGVFYLAGGLDAVENRMADARFGLSERIVDSDLVLITIDPESLETLDVWPWPRNFYAALILKQ